MKRSLDVAAVIAMVTCCGTAQAQETLTFPSPDTARLAREVPDLLQVSDVPGLSMAVVRAGQVVWSGAFGTVNDSAKHLLDAGTVFEAASLSKPVFAYLVLRLAVAHGAHGRRSVRARAGAGRSSPVSRRRKATGGGAGGDLPGWKRGPMV